MPRMLSLLNYLLHPKTWYHGNKTNSPLKFRFNIFNWTSLVVTIAYNESFQSSSNAICKEAVERET